MRLTILLFAAIGIVACSNQSSNSSTQPIEVATSTPVGGTSVALADILAAQPDAVKARFTHRHPQQTLEFFGIEPGMTVVEALPGGGWYSKILMPYLGPQGELIGVNYAYDMWSGFPFANEDFLARMKTWSTDWPAGARDWELSSPSKVSAFVFGELDAGQRGSADAVLLVRALHNIARSSAERDFLGEALKDVHDVLKPGGIVGIVQHEARANMPDSWADGSNGYLKKSFIIERMQKAGFDYVGESGINANPKDRPTASEYVWRLPPSYRDAGDDADKRAVVDAIGESNRMTLKFVKPSV